MINVLLLRKLFLIPVFFLFHSLAIAQVPSDTAVIDIDSVKTYIRIYDKSFLFIDSVTKTPISKITEQKFVPFLSFKKRRPVPFHLITKPAYISFTIYNSKPVADSICFFPGFLFTEIDLYKKTGNGTLEKINTWGTASGYPSFSMGPNETIEVVARLIMCKNDFIALTPFLISKKYLDTYQRIDLHQYEDIRTTGFILSGLLAMMILFTAANFFLTGKKEFLYYCIYSLCTFFLIFFYAYFYKQPGRINSYFLGYFDFFFLLAGTIFYIAFTRSFLDTKRHYKSLDKLFRIEEWFLTILLLIYTILHYFTDYFWLENMIEISMKFIALAIGVVYVVVALSKRRKLLNYLAIGNGLLIFFSCVSLVMILIKYPMSSVLTAALFYYEAGLILGLVFFLIGLVYKNRMELIEKIKVEEAMKLEAKKQEFENQLNVFKAQQEERNRISADMHDDLGAGMTAIRLYSELAKDKIKGQDIPEINKISSSADELLNKMNAIIWSMSSSNDSLGNMVAYIRSYAIEYFDETGIRCTINLPDAIPEMEVNGEIRRNVFLVVKEALNNALKHSNATQVSITFTINEKLLQLFIQDNGKGIDMENLRQFGNGLKNMKKRMDDVRIGFAIENKNGTLITLTRTLRN